MWLNEDLAVIQWGKDLFIFLNPYRFLESGIFNLLRPMDFSLDQLIIEEYYFRRILVFLTLLLK